MKLVRRRPLPDDYWSRACTTTQTIEIDSSPGNAHGIPRMAHSVLTEDLVDRDGHPTAAALARVLSFLADNLLDVRSRDGASMS